MNILWIIIIGIVTVPIGFFICRNYLNERQISIGIYVNLIIILIIYSFFPKNLVYYFVTFCNAINLGLILGIKKKKDG